MSRAADYAAQSDPARNRHFSRRWEDPPEPRRAPRPPPDDLDTLADRLAADWRTMRRAGGV